MATVKETMMQDAVKNVGTAYMMSAGDTFEGKLDTKLDEDWIRIEMSAGMRYTIKLAGAEDGVADTVLEIFDSKGDSTGRKKDDDDGAKGDLNSTVIFDPEVDGTYYISASAFQDNQGQDNMGAYTVTVTAMRVDRTRGPDIIGTEAVMDDDDTTDVNEFMAGHDKIRGTDRGELIKGLSGDDSLYGAGGDDTLDGGSGSDLLRGGPGKDTLIGGASDPAANDEDTISYNVSPAGVTINLTDGTARGGNAEGDTIVNSEAGGKIENVVGSGHPDELTGDRYDNKLWGLGGVDELDGGRGDDKLYGGAGEDMLDGGRGNDVLEGGPGGDTLIGGASGEAGDTASYAASAMGVTVRLHNSKFDNGDAKDDSFGMMVSAEYTVVDEDGENPVDHKVDLPDIINLTGSAHADVLAGDLRNNTIMGGGGDDRIYGGPSPKGATGDGDDTNEDELRGEGGNDLISGGAGDDMLFGGAGNDMLVGGPGDDTYYGGAGSDTIYADADDTTINGWVMTPPADITGTDPDESMEAVSDPMTADTVSYARVENEDDKGIIAILGDTSTSTAELDGGMTISNVENITGTQYKDSLTGDGGNNVIEGGDLGDVMDGGAGIDTLSYAGSDDRVRVTLDDAANTVAEASKGHARGDEAQNFENITGSAYDDELEGNTGPNVLKGGDGDDELVGDTGADTLEGGAGADELDGGASRASANEPGDTLSYEGSTAGVRVNLTAGSVSVSGGHADNDTIVTIETDHDEDNARSDDKDPTDELEVSTFENVTGSKYDDTLTGDYRDNDLRGGAGDDHLRGGTSSATGAVDESAADRRGDVLRGGPGEDVLDGGEDKGEGDNNMVDTGKDGRDNDGDGEFDEDDEEAMVSASIDWAVYKEAPAGVMVTLTGMGNGMGTGGEAEGDTLRDIELVWGSEHNDIFIAGPGADIIEGDGGSDTVSYEASEQGVTVDLSDDAHNRTAIATGDGTASPFVFIKDANPAAITTHVTAVGVLSIPETAGTPASPDNPETNGAAGDKLGSIENLTGTAQKDVLTGDENPNVLKGMGGDDTLAGGANNDTLDGGAGVDTLDGGAGDDMLMGGAGDDILDGDGDDDMLNGGAGDDDLSGGGGNDTFIFTQADAGDSDVILDWDRGVRATTGDQIDLSAFELTREQLKGAMTLRGSGDEAYLVINLTEYGGGRITIDDIGDWDDLEITGTDEDNELDSSALSVGEDGIFIL